MPINLLDLLSPHYCISCGGIGDILCEYCKYDITDEGFAGCVVCRSMTHGSTNLCASCQQSYSKAWCVGERSQVLRKLLDAYKFDRKVATKHTLSSLLDTTVPVLPTDTMVSYVTTIPAHIRQRGHDHARSLAESFAKRRRLPIKKTLSRKTNTRQFGSTRKQRIENAKSAFEVCTDVTDLTVLLIDDILTTGATLEHASKCLKDAGAREVWAAVVARQPLEK